MEGCGVRWLEQRSLDERRLVAAASSAHGDLCAVLIDADARLRVFGRHVAGPSAAALGGAVALEHCHAVSFGDRAGLVLCADGGLFYVDVGNFDDELPWLRRVEGLPPAACVRAVAGGGARLLAVAEDGALYAVTLIGAKCVAQPVPRPPGTARVVAVAVGGDHALFVTEAGALYAFGAGGNGRLGLGDERPATVAQRVGVPLKCAWVAAGAAHSFVVCAGGECFGFGANARGQLGVGDADDRAMPTRLRLVPPKSIGAGSEHTVVASHDGKASAFGRADVVGAARDELRPRRIQALQGIKIVLVDAGRDYSHAVAADGAVYCWGRARGGGFSPARSPAPLAARTTAECAVCAREMHRAAMDARLPPLPRAAARMQPRDAEPPFPFEPRSDLDAKFDADDEHATHAVFIAMVETAAAQQRLSLHLSLHDCASKGAPFEVTRLDDVKSAKLDEFDSNTVRLTRAVGGAETVDSFTFPLPQRGERGGQAAEWIGTLDRWRTFVGEWAPNRRLFEDAARDAAREAAAARDVVETSEAAHVEAELRRHK